MLITMLTAMYVMVQVVESIGARFSRKPDSAPYMVSQPLPWQVHSVSHSRRSSRAEEYESYRRNSLGVYKKNSTGGPVTNGTTPEEPPLSPVEIEKAAATIQNQFRKYQLKKQKDVE